MHAGYGREARDQVGTTTLQEGNSELDLAAFGRETPRLAGCLVDLEMLEVVRSPTADTRDGEVLPAHARWLDGAGKFLGQVPGRPQRLVAAHAQGKVTQDDIVLATLELRLDRRRTAIAEIRDSSHRLEAGMLDGRQPRAGRSRP